MGDAPLIFDVEGKQQVGPDKNDSVWVAYKDFVKNMHDVGDWEPTESSLKTKPHIDVVLHTSRHGIRLRLSRWTYHIMGYQVVGSSSSSPDGPWLEFGLNVNPARWSLRITPEPNHLIPGSILMDINYDYKELEKNLNPPESLSTIQLGQHDLVIAVDTLATTADLGERAKYLIVVSLMVCQGSRFPEICDHLAKQFSCSSSLPDEMMSSVMKYESYPLESLLYVSKKKGANAPKGDVAGSKRKSDSILNGATEDYDDGDYSEIGMAEFDNLFKEVGLDEDESDILHDEADVGEGMPGSLRMKLRRSDFQVSQEQAPALSGSPIVFPHPRRPLAEVFFLRIDELIGEKPGYFYGTITIDDYLYQDIIYNRAKEEAESVMPGQTVQLTGPSPPISARSQFEFRFALMGEQECPYGGQLCWDKNSRALQHEYNKVVVEDFDGEHCTVSMCYVAYDDAILAVFGVEIIKSKVGDVGQLWGEIGARCLKFDQERVIFHKEKTNFVEAHLGKPLSLSRSTVVVPCGAGVKVEVKLHMSDEEFVSGSIIFPAQSDGESYEIISGSGGTLRVRITWK